MLHRVIAGGTVASFPWMLGDGPIGQALLPPDQAYLNERENVRNAELYFTATQNLKKQNDVDDLPKMG